MSKKSREIIVMYDTFFVRFVSKFVIAVLCIVTVWTAISQEVNAALLVSTSVTLILPFTWGAVWLKTFKVIVNGSTIIVRRYWSKKEFCLDDCIKIKHKIVDTDFIHSERISVTAKKCKFSVDSSMNNYKTFRDYIMSNLSSEKIEIKKNNMRTKKK